MQRTVFLENTFEQAFRYFGIDQFTAIGKKLFVVKFNKYNQRTCSGFFHAFAGINNWLYPC
ncbi:hypothetical protein D3C73_1291240 [compost metagenome]